MLPVDRAEGIIDAMFVVDYQRTDYMEPSPSSDAYSCSVS